MPFYMFTFRFLSLFPDIPSDSSLSRLFRSFELAFWRAAFEVFLYQITYVLAFDFLAPYVHEQAVGEGAKYWASEYWGRFADHLKALRPERQLRENLLFCFKDIIFAYLIFMELTY